MSMEAVNGCRVPLFCLFFFCMETAYKMSPVCLWDTHLADEQLYMFFLYTARLAHIDLH